MKCCQSAFYTVACGKTEIGVEGEFNQLKFHLLLLPFLKLYMVSFCGVSIVDLFYCLK